MTTAAIPKLDIQPAPELSAPLVEPEPVLENEPQPDASAALKTVSEQDNEPAHPSETHPPSELEIQAKPEAPPLPQSPIDEKTPVPEHAPDADIPAAPSPEPDMPPTPIPETAPRPSETGLFSKLKSGLSKTRKLLNTDITELFTSSTIIDEALFDELEERLVTADLGIDVTMDLMDRVRQQAKTLKTGDQLKAVLKKEMLSLFPEAVERPAPVKPHVIMMVGVNGTGKTTTLGKLAMRYKNQGKKVLIGAADTFRAAAIEQVEVWAERSGAGIVRHKEGADPAAVAYDTVEAAMARNVDVVLIDTAGRLHTQKNLMEELKKIKRSINKKFNGAPHEVMLVIDATTGQNAMSQAKIFNEAVALTQISVTKLDGTAKGGIVAAVSSAMDLPIAYIGVGEAIEDLQDFDAKKFIDALFD
ncbi:MAG: signal recognition particle-docking protein FtsY [Desulfobacterales bacterium]|nr:MAG: signal recognition particle-docking protein FtsY [Desulfobacterales bacterium]